MEGSEFVATLAATIDQRIAEMELEQDRLKRDLERVGIELVALLDAHKALARALDMPPAPELDGEREAAVEAVKVGIEKRPEGNGERIRIAIPGVSTDRVYGVMNAVRGSGNGATVDELAKETGYSLAHVKIITRELGKAGYLRDAGRTPTRAKIWAAA